ncbi:uncharacterized protein LOC135200395 [Macrobrachium nipponense]|uniref:uncharacterized protein LOC135200395 n=1 Tax=Macrobrachium nipponense TaxID=159736 RepID=UPI0030C8532C
MEKAFSSRRVLVVLLHLLCVLMRNCLVYGKNSMPCHVVNRLTGAVVCCPSAQGTLQAKGCKTLYPKRSLPLMPGTWSVESYVEATSPWLQQLEVVNSSCCCREKVDLILPDHVASVNGSSQAKVVQHSAGYVQPVFVRTCEEQACSSGSTEHTVFSCTQRWALMDLYTENQLYSGFMHLEKVWIPDGCSCREKQAKAEEHSKNGGSSFEEDLSGIKDSFSVRLPASSNNELPRPGELSARQRTLKVNSKSNVFKRDATAANSSEPYNYLEASDIRIPSSILVSYNSTSDEDKDESSYLKNILAAYAASQNLPLVSLEQYEGEHYFTDAGGSAINLKGLSDLVNKSQGSEELFLHSIFQNNSNSNSSSSSSSRCKDKRNCSSSEHSSKYSDSDLNSTHRQQPSALLPEQQSDSVKSSQLANSTGVSNLLDVMNYNLKVGLLGGTFGRMTTAEIMKNILNHVPENERAYAQSAAENMMLTEMEYLKTSLKMLEILLNSTGSLEDVVNTPKLSPNLKDSAKAPLISRPDINSPIRFESIDAPIFSNPTFQGNKENIEGNFRKELSLGISHNKVNVSSVGLTQPEKGDLHFNRSLLPTVSQVGNFSATPEASQQPSTGSGPRMADRVEEELHAAFANFVFQEAWTNLSCRVPDTVGQAVSEVNFLPPLIKKGLDPEAKGVLDINKFTGRIIAGIISCHISDHEEALKDGRLATAISGGVMAAELLNKQVEIIKRVMQGLLDTSDAKKITGILKWSVRSTGVLSRGEFLNSKDQLQMDNLLTTLNNSLSKYYVEFLKGKISSNTSANSSSNSVLSSVSSAGSAGDRNRSETALNRTTPGVGTVTPLTTTPPSVGNLTSSGTATPPSVGNLTSFSTAKPPGSTPDVNRTENTPTKTTPGVGNGTSTTTPSVGSVTTSITTPTSVGTVTSPTNISPGAGNVTATATLPSGGNVTSTVAPPNVGNATTTTLIVGNVTSSTTPSNAGNTSNSSTTNKPTPAVTRVSTIPSTTEAPGSFNSVSPATNVTVPSVNVTTAAPRQDITNVTTSVQASSTTRENVSTTPSSVITNVTRPSTSPFTNSSNSTVSPSHTEVTSPSRNKTYTAHGSTTKAYGNKYGTLKNRTEVSGSQDYEYKDYEYNDYGYVDDTLGGYFGNKHKHGNGTYRESLDAHKDRRLENTNASDSAAANISIIFEGGNKVHASRPTAADKVKNKNDTGKVPQEGKEEDVDYDYKDRNDYIVNYDDYENEKGIFKVKEEVGSINDVYEAHSVKPSISKDKYKDSEAESDDTDSENWNDSADYKNDELDNSLLYNSEEKVKNNVDGNEDDDGGKLNDREEKNINDELKDYGYVDEPIKTDEDSDRLPDSDDELRNGSDEGNHHHHHHHHPGGQDDNELPEEYNPIDMSPLNLYKLFSNLNL